MNTRGVKKYFFRKGSRIIDTRKKDLPVEKRGMEWIMLPKDQKEINEEQKRIEEKSRELKSVKLSNPPVWTDVYELPFKLNHGWFYDSKNFFCFQTQARLSDEGEQKLLELLNGKNNLAEPLQVEIRNEIEIWVKKSESDWVEFLLIRGWGGLTGTGYGGRALSSETAATIQNSLAVYIKERLESYGQ